MSHTNKALKKAYIKRNDEFYTQLSDIVNELKHYEHHFKDKVVYCNCDDPKESNFYRYFLDNFERLQLRKLLVSGYRLKEEDKQYNIDFRSEESIELLKQADIVVTNPPFSLFREYVAQLMKYDKKFLLIGNKNAVTYHQIFPLIKENKLWLGFNFRNITGFRTDKNDIVKSMMVTWFTNLEINKRNEILPLTKKYNSIDYPKYDNYNAINVNKLKDIPMDYDGVMGVPITFLAKHNSNQFEIIGLGNGLANFTPNKVYINSWIISKNYKRRDATINSKLTLEKENKPQGTYYISDNSKYIVLPYARILIKIKNK